MLNKKYFHIIIAALIMICFCAAPAFAGKDSKKGKGKNCRGQKSLFVNLTTDDINAAAMAINFAKMTRMKKGIPVTIFMNAQGTRLADANRPAAIWVGTEEVPPTNVHELLEAFMVAGGKVIVCPMCSRNVAGMDLPEDLFSFHENLVIGTYDDISEALLAPNVSVLSY